MPAWWHGKATSWRSCASTSEPQTDATILIGAFAARPAAAFPDAGLRHLSCLAGAQHRCCESCWRRMNCGWPSPCNRSDGRALQRGPAFRCWPKERLMPPRARALESRAQGARVPHGPAPPIRCVTPRRALRRRCDEISSCRMWRVDPSADSPVSSQGVAPSILV